MYHVGVDWADDHHDIYIIDDEGKKVDSFQIAHDFEGMTSFRNRVLKLPASKEQILFAIETPKNLLVDFLLDEGYTVYTINPKSVDRYRDRYRVSAARDDTFDAMVIANIIRTDRDKHRAIIPNSLLARELKILTRDEQRLIRLKTRLINQIRACLKEYYPVALELFSEIDIAVTVDFLLKYPAHSRITVNKLEKFLRQHRHSGAVKKAKEIHEKLAAPQMFVEEFTARAKSRLLITLVEQLKSLRSQLDEYQKEISLLFDQHPDSNIFKSLPGSGDKSGPRLLAEMGDNRERYSDRSELQCIAGTAPITDKSGKMKHVRMRFARNKTFHNVVYQFAFVSLQKSVWARKFYDAQKAKGKTHTKALRALGNKWLKIIFKLWKDENVYNEDIHLANLMRYQFDRGDDKISQIFSGA